jgi:hypothetical protein
MIVSTIDGDAQSNSDDGDVQIIDGTDIQQLSGDGIGNFSVASESVSSDAGSDTAPPVNNDPDTINLTTIRTSLNGLSFVPGSNIPIRQVSDPESSSSEGGDYF